jgi:hypothetical protein
MTCLHHQLIVVIVIKVQYLLAVVILVAWYMIGIHTLMLEQDTGNIVFILIR